MAQPPTIDPGKRRRPPRPLLRRVLGDGLRRTRLEQGRTLADVAAAARVSMQYLSELERGRKEASSEILDALCDALDVDLADLLADVRRPAFEGRDRAPVVRLESIRVTSRRRGSGMPGGSGDPVCLAA
ncbi:MAG TPA: helix-turn-helix transcriptional regulator [Nocardioidaceae bacterium]|nr:helix-turn-helix transcriptional regulator [Nocardioidaceae bacterium]